MEITTEETSHQPQADATTVEAPSSLAHVTAECPADSQAGEASAEASNPVEVGFELPASSDVATLASPHVEAMPDIVASQDAESKPIDSNVENAGIADEAAHDKPTVVDAAQACLAEVAADKSVENEPTVAEAPQVDVADAPDKHDDKLPVGTEQEAVDADTSEKALDGEAGAAADTPHVAAQTLGDEAPILETFTGDNSDPMSGTAATAEISSLYVPEQVMPVKDEPELSLSATSPQVCSPAKVAEVAGIALAEAADIEEQAALTTPKKAHMPESPTMEKQADVPGVDMAVPAAVVESGTPTKATVVTDATDMVDADAVLFEEASKEVLVEAEPKAEEACEPTTLAEDASAGAVAVSEMAPSADNASPTDRPQEAVGGEPECKQDTPTLPDDSTKIAVAAESAGASAEEPPSTQEVAASAAIEPDVKPTEVSADSAPADNAEMQESFVAVFPEATPEMLSLLSGASDASTPKVEVKSPSRPANMPTGLVSMLPPPPLPAKERSVSSSHQSAEIIQVDLTSIVDKTPETLDVTQPVGDVLAASVEDDDDVGLLASNDPAVEKIKPVKAADGIDSASESDHGDGPAATALRQQKAQEASRAWQEAASATSSATPVKASPSEAAPPAERATAPESKPVTPPMHAVPAPRKQDAQPPPPTRSEGPGRVAAAAALTTPGAPAVCRVQAPNKFPGVQFRKSKKKTDRLSIHAKSGETVTGVVEYDEEGEKWLKVNELGEIKYLPFAIDGLALLVQEQPSTAKPSDTTDETDRVQHLREQHMREHNTGHAIGSAPEHEYLEESAPTPSNGGWNLFCCMATPPPQSNAGSQPPAGQRPAASQQPPTFLQRLFG